MIKELDNFIIKSDTQIDYFNDLVNYIIENEKRILSFFRLERLPNKVEIRILSYKPFKEFIISQYGEILDYVAGYADYKTNIIRQLNIEDQIKYTTHKKANIYSTSKMIIHEIVHKCHQVYNTDCRETTWFSEGLATNLAFQDRELKNLDECDFNTLKSDFRHYKGNYDFAYTLVKYILNNYSEEEIYMLYTNANYVREKSELIFNEAKDWVNNQINNIKIK